MSELIRCACCKGSKKIIGLGLIEKECPECNGVGWKEKKDEPSKTPEAIKFEKLGKVNVIYKKRGPKKGWKKSQVKNEEL